MVPAMDAVLRYPCSKSMILLDPSHEADFKSHLDLFEGRCAWPYLDTEGNVTIGVGCMVPSLPAFEALRWEGGMGSTALAQGEWDNLRASRAGMRAQAYETVTVLRLPDIEIDALRDARINAAEVSLVHSVPGISTMPQAAKQGLIDMSWNMGMAKLHSQFFETGRKFGPAVLRGDWGTAAAECARRDIQPSRNQYTSALFYSLAGDRNGSTGNGS